MIASVKASLMIPSMNSIKQFLPLCIRLIDCCVILGLMVMDDGFDREPCKQRIPLREQQRVPEPPDATISICEWMNHLKFIVKHAAFD